MTASELDATRANGETHLRTDGFAANLAVVKPPPFSWHAILAILGFASAAPAARPVPREEMQERRDRLRRMQGMGRAHVDGVNQPRGRHLTHAREGAHLVFGRRVHECSSIVRTPALLADVNGERILFDSHRLIDDGGAN